MLPNKYNQAQIYKVTQTAWTYYSLLGKKKKNLALGSKQGNISIFVPCLF